MYVFKGPNLDCMHRIYTLILLDPKYGYDPEIQKMTPKYTKYIV